MLWKQKAAVAFAILFPTLITYVYFVLLADGSTDLQRWSYSIGKILQFGFPLAWAWYLPAAPRREPVATHRGIPLGFAMGLAVATLGLALYHWVLWPAGYFDGPVRAAAEDKIVGLGLNTTSKYVLLVIFYCVIHAALEEYYWRWFVFRRATEFTSVPAAMAMSSLGFMAHHVLVLANYFGWRSPITYLFSLAVAIGGAIWAWIYHRAGSLLGCWVSHLLVDAMIFAIGYDLVRGIMS